MELTNLDTPIETKNKVPGKSKHEFGSEVIEGFIVLQSTTYSFKNDTSKEKKIKKKTIANMKTILMQ